MMGSICGQTFISIHLAMFELLPFSKFFLLFLLLYLSKIFSSDTAWPIWTKIGMNVPWGILLELIWGFLICWKTWLPLLKMERRGQTVVSLHISKKCQVKLNSFNCWNDPYYKAFKSLQWSKLSATPCQSYCSWKMKNEGFFLFVFFLQISANILKTIIDRENLSIAKMILMISPTKVFFSQTFWTIPC